MFFKKQLTTLITSAQIKSTLIQYNLKKNTFLNKTKTSRTLLNNYFTEILYQTKKQYLLKKKTRFFRQIIKKFRVYFKKPNFSKSFRDINLELDITNLTNSLKKPINFQYTGDKLKYSKLMFKYTGSNFFVTITDIQGNVFFSYSSGFFSGLRTRKEKTTVFVVKQLGELVALRLYKSNLGETIFVPFINHRKIRTFLRFFRSGLRLITKLHFVKLIPKRKVLRNGVRLRKVARK